MIDYMNKLLQPSTLCDSKLHLKEAMKPITTTDGILYNNNQIEISKNHVIRENMLKRSHKGKLAGNPK